MRQTIRDLASCFFLFYILWGINAALLYPFHMTQHGLLAAIAAIGELLCVLLFDRVGEKERRAMERMVQTGKR
jgi:hypothetical protein